MRHHSVAIVPLALLVLLVYTRLYPPHLIGTHLYAADGFESAWFVNWGQHILWRAPWRYFEIPLFHPEQGMGALNEYSPLLALITAPLRLFRKPALSANGAMLLAPVLVALGGYAACWLVTRHRRASVVGGFILAANGDMLWHAWGHPNLLFPAFMALGLVLFCLYILGGVRGHAIAAAVCLLLQFLASMHLGVIMLVGLGILWLMGSAVFPRRMLAPVALLLPVLVVVYTMSRPYAAKAHELGLTRSLADTAVYSADLGGYLIPVRQEGFARTLPGRLLSTPSLAPQRLENAQFTGWLALVLAIIGFGKAVRTRGRNDSSRVLLMLGVVAASGFVLSLGPFLWWWNGITGLRLPYYYVYTLIPPFRIIRAVARFGALVMPFVGVAAAFALSSFGWFNRGGWLVRTTLCGILLLLMLVEYLPVERPPMVRLPRGDAEALAASPGITAAVPLHEPLFLAANAHRFSPTPSGHLGGVYTHRRERQLTLTADFPSTRALATYVALGVDNLIVYRQDLRHAADASPFLKPIQGTPEWGIYRIADIPLDEAQETRHLVESIPARPPLPEGGDFPASAPESARWVPDNWQWLDDASPPQWHWMQWADMQDPGFVYTDLQQAFYAPLAARPLRQVARVHVRLAIADPGPAYIRSRIQWLSDDVGTWTAAHSAEAFLVPNGEPQVVTFDLSAVPAWNADATVGALLFEPTTTPWPGLRVRLYEIRIEPGP